MASVKYTYAKIVAPDTLEFQIRQSQIKVALDNITARSTDFDVSFKQTLDSNDESILTAIVNAHLAIPLLYQGEPTDMDGAKIQRPKAAKAGWANQLHAVTFKTSTLASVNNKSLNPVTRVLADLGFATLKFYASDKTTELTAQQDMANVCYTVLDWKVSHDMEIVGGSFYQADRPETDIWMYTHLAPGILNYPFIQGGANLRMIGGAASGSGPIDNDGKVAKFLSATQPFVGANLFRSTFIHNAGVQHEGMFLFKLFKSVT